MIYISSSCVKFPRISESIRFLADQGFRNIELSGGTNYYEQMEVDLLNLKKEFCLSFLIHNYFPPPREHFVLNLSSTDNQVYKSSFRHYENAILLARKLDVKKIGIHAGYLIDPKLKELGKEISMQKMIDREEGTSRFCEAYDQLKFLAGDIKIYVENNVVSNKNFNTYNANPFLLTHYDDFMQLRGLIDFPLILDVAHLKVSCQTLGLDYKEELTKLLTHTDYIHLSENDGRADTNMALEYNANLKTILESGIENKTVTLEIYDGIEKIRASYELLK